MGFAGPQFGAAPDGRAGGDPDLDAAQPQQRPGRDGEQCGVREPVGQGGNTHVDFDGDEPGQVVYPIAAGSLALRAVVAAGVEGKALKAGLEALRKLKKGRPPLFGLMHFITPTYAVLATLMGAYLGLVWQWTGNLLAVVLMHALYDFLVLLYLLRGPGSSLQPEDKPGEPAA